MIPNQHFPYAEKKRKRKQKEREQQFRLTTYEIEIGRETQNRLEEERKEKNMVLVSGQAERARAITYYNTITVAVNNLMSRKKACNMSGY